MRPLDIGRRFNHGTVSDGARSWRIASYCSGGAALGEKYENAHFSTAFASLAVAVSLLATAPQAAADEPVFTETEQVIIREVLQQTGVIPNERDGVRVERETTVEHGHKGGGKGMPPGLAKKRGLPPGLAKRDRLPPGLEKRALPNDLESRLPRRTTTERIIVDDDVILIEKGTEIVLDILRDVVHDG